MTPIWNRLAMLLMLFPTQRVETAFRKTVTSVDERDVVRRWRKARLAHPELMGDVIRLGGVLAAQPMDKGEVEPLDASRLAYEAGRRDFALQLLAMMQISIDELNHLTERDDE